MEITTFFKRFFLLLITFFLTTTSLFAQSYIGFRGPSRNGVYNETGLLKTWPDGGPQLLWTTEDVGKGFSSPVIVGDRLYITGLDKDDENEVFLAYTLEGKKIYEKAYGKPWESYPSDTRVTPTIVGDKAYITSGVGEVVCINISNGDIVWKVDGTEFGINYSTWGIAESPLVFDNIVIFSPGGDNTAMVAINATTGEISWQSEGFGGLNNYFSPILITHNGKKQIIGVADNYIIGVNPGTGKIEWKFDDWGRPDEGENVMPNLPIYLNGRIFFSSGYDIGCFILQLNDDATAVSLVWHNDDLDTHHGGFVLVNGTVFGTSWINNSQGNWIAVDWESGATRYNTPWGKNGKGSIIAADNMLYCYDERQGTVGLVKANPEEFDVVSEFRITKGRGSHWAHPVINKGILYIRHGNALMAYKIN